MTYTGYLGKNYIFLFFQNIQLVIFSHLLPSVIMLKKISDRKIRRKIFCGIASNGEKKLKGDTKSLKLSFVRYIILVRVCWVSVWKQLLKARLKAIFSWHVASLSVQKKWRQRKFLHVDWKISAIFRYLP